MVDYRQAREHMKEIGSPLGWGNTALVAEALGRGIDVSATDTKPRIVFRHEGLEHRWQNGRTTLNSPLAKVIGLYKDLQSRLFLNHGVNAPEGAIFQPGQAERAWNWAQPLGVLVVKPHDGTHGAGVHVGIDNWGDFLEAFESVASSRSQVLVEKFHSGVEHRCLVVDNKLVAATRRRPASVVGDGESTIEELVTEKNRSRGRIHKNIQMGVREDRYLRKHGWTFDMVPPDGERVYLVGASNIHAGGDAIDATSEIRPGEKAVIEKAVRAVPGLRVVGLDVLLPREEGDSDLTIIEINHMPMTAMHHFPWEGRRRNVSSAIIDAMFPDTKSSTRQ